MLTSRIIDILIDILEEIIENPYNIDSLCHLYPLSLFERGSHVACLNMLKANFLHGKY